MVTYYFALTDGNGVLCVDEMDGIRKFAEQDMAEQAANYPEVIYFVVDNTDPEFRVPVKKGGWA